MNRKEELEHQMNMAELTLLTALEEKNRIRKELGILCRCCDNAVKHGNLETCIECADWLYHQDMMDREAEEERLEQEAREMGYYNGTYYDRNGHWYD